MNKSVAKSLLNKVKEAEKNFSNPQRANNHNGETFKAIEVRPISAQSAYVIFLKSSGKKAKAHFINKQPKIAHWEYYFIGAQHLLNLDVLEKKYLEVEQFNFKFNFEEEYNVK